MAREGRRRFEKRPRAGRRPGRAAALTPYAWEFRYPDDLAETEPTREEFNEALKQAQEIYDFVASLLPKAAQPILKN